MSLASVVYDDHLDVCVVGMLLRLVLVSALTLDGGEGERRELLPATVLQSALDLVTGYHRTDSGRSARENQVSLLHRDKPV